MLRLEGGDTGLPLLLVAPVESGDFGLMMRRGVSQQARALGGDGGLCLTARLARGRKRLSVGGGGGQGMAD